MMIKQVEGAVKYGWGVNGSLAGLMYDSNPRHVLCDVLTLPPPPPRTIPPNADPAYAPHAAAAFPHARFRTYVQLSRGEDVRGYNVAVGRGNDRSAAAEGRTLIGRVFRGIQSELKRSLIERVY